MESLNQAIIQIRVDLQNSNIKKSGKNRHAGFSYFELGDFLPKLNELMRSYGVNDIVSINNDLASITLTKGEESQTYSIPFIMFDTPLSKSGNKMMQDIQYLGALNTYYKRYLYLNAFGITDGEIVDALDNKDLQAPDKYDKSPQSTKYAKMTEMQKSQIINFIQEGKLDLEGIKSYYKINNIDELNYQQAVQVVNKGKKAK